MAFEFGTFLVDALNCYLLEGKAMVWRVWWCSVCGVCEAIFECSVVFYLMCINAHHAAGLDLDCRPRSMDCLFTCRQTGKK